MRHYVVEWLRLWGREYLVERVGGDGGGRSALVGVTLLTQHALAPADGGRPVVHPCSPTWRLSANTRTCTRDPHQSNPVKPIRKTEKKKSVWVTSLPDTYNTNTLTGNTH